MTRAQLHGTGWAEEKRRQDAERRALTWERRRSMAIWWGLFLAGAIGWYLLGGGR
jgi:hypothetical protein